MSNLQSFLGPHPAERVVNIATLNTTIFIIQLLETLTNFRLLSTANQNGLVSTNNLLDRCDNGSSTTSSNFLKFTFLDLLQCNSSFFNLPSQLFCNILERETSNRS